jgi:hypothetical protein
MIDPASEFSIEPGLVETLVPELKLTDKMFRDGRLDNVVERLLSLSQKWPSHPTIRYRLITAYHGTYNPDLVREHVLSLRADEVLTDKASAILSQCLFHSLAELGDLDAAVCEAQEYFLRNPTETSSYRDAAEELCELRKKWSDEAIVAKIVFTRARSFVEMFEGDDS